ncbi:putative 3-hydroxybutyryl-CoA dehydrogenase [Saccoglossus kowalevskii]|uniref:Peroxisomal fatty acid beta-oxidation multifunctional protein AIM1-like n=1 Tax=Saccoglossus kowalevskii TaxID=10224 RepID=A0ABM0LZF8_SACKO|nr:PREDICTED: peroxisomal fatty acid beta-oxidation multifunctional protein AIM1-like [Saccoglossus kowalevskii]
MVRIAVIGCGLMGTKIAGDMAYHGHRVKIYDHNPAALDVFYHNLADDKEELKNEGLMTHPNFLGQVLCMSRLEETVIDAEFIFEAVIDDLQIKQDLFESVSHLCSPTAVIGSNTLYLDMNKIIEKAAYKERILGLRFLHPVYTIPEVEITATKFTTSQNVEKVRHLLERIGKTLFFRSGQEPLILSEEQIESRKQARREQLRRQRGLMGIPEVYIPQLGHNGNLSPPQDDDLASVNDRDCAICMDRQRDCLLCPCHHMITCMECAKSLLNRKDFCPICRKDITEIIRVFHS